MRMKLKRAQRMQLGKVIMQASREERGCKGEENKKGEGAAGECNYCLNLNFFNLILMRRALARFYSLRA